jgi:hypothetical protein
MMDNNDNKLLLLIMNHVLLLIRAHNNLNFNRLQRSPLFFFNYFCLTVCDQGALWRSDLLTDCVQTDRLCKYVTY